MTGERESARGFWGALGPGLLFAAAAVGVSHLVQSTRAGAQFGLGLVGVVLLANLIKYPAFRFGPYYTAATGSSLLTGYRNQGRWALVVYGLATVSTMFTVQAAITLVTAALAISALGIPASPLVVSIGLSAMCAGLLAIGRYRILDRLTKVLVAILTVSTLAATALVLPRVDWSTLGVVPVTLLSDPKAALFVAALIGWMPSAIDVSVWQSLWTLARERDSGHKPTLKESSLDFHVGYAATAFLALCFVLLGAGVMHHSGETFAGPATKFTEQVIQLYTKTLGDWAGPLIGLSALAVMFSTTITVVDGFPRALAGLGIAWTEPASGQPSGDPADESPRARRFYWGGLAILSAGSLAIIAWFLSSLKVLVDVATTLSFLTAPILSWLNHRAVLGPEVPAGARPGRRLVRFSAAAIAVQAGLALWYLALVAWS